MTFQLFKCIFEYRRRTVSLREHDEGILLEPQADTIEHASAEQRIDGMIETHHMLTEAKWAPMRLSALASGIIDATLVSLPESKTINLLVAPSPVTVSSQQASHLALIFNELATNTLKYAMEGRNEGQITVEITEEDGRISLTYRDDGPGYPEPIKESIGLSLIHRLTENTLGGDVTLDNDNGAVATLRFAVE